ncbi:MAG TPA: DUF5686 and carboxypeptidase regulatory-like domain-containing protein [Bacteroidia bacterium]|nr:DUF5686 and carboxypeptidase regulatory-like domain-containing protein [Bacteroidia bacterium]
MNTSFFKRVLLSLTILIAFGANSFAGVIKGTVRDTLGQPIPYVLIMEKNTSYGINTNLDGSYFLELKAGTHTLVFSQLGLATQEHVVVIPAGKSVILDVVMKTTSKELGAVEIVAKGDRDKGKEIMKKVVARRDNYWKRVDNYKCKTYQKSSLEKYKIQRPGGDSLYAKEEPEKDNFDSALAKIDTTKRRGRKKAARIKEQQKQSAQLKRAFADKPLNLIESISITYFDSPNRFKENVLAYHDYAPRIRYDGGEISGTVGYGEHEIIPMQWDDENPYMLMNNAQSMDFNFYKNYIDAPALATRPLLSPAAATAFLNYRFEFLNSFEENGKTYHKISVIPLFKEDALFSGFLFIEDSTWAIKSVNLAINPGVLLYCKEFFIIQDYSEVKAGIFLPVRREFIYTIREGKYNIIGNTRADHSDYEVNIQFPKKTFNDEIRHYDDAAFDRDSAYWVNNRTIQLKDKEISYIHSVDSLEAYYASEEYLNKADSSYNHINVWSFLLNGVAHRNRFTGNDWFIDPLINQMIFFGVGGYRHRLGGSYSHDYKNGFKLETEGQIDYGFKNRDIRGKVGVGLTYYPLKFVRTFVRFGDFYDMVNTYASLESVFSRSNYVRCREFSIAQRMEITNGLFAELTFEYSDQFPINNMQLEAWSSQVFGSLNTPLDFERYVKTEFRLELKYRFKQKYIIKKHRKIIVGSKYPEIRAYYRKGVPGLLGSEVNFDYIEFGSTDEMKIGRFGTSSWNVLYGAFLNKHNLRLLEYKYFRGSDSFIFSDPMRSFQLLGPTLNTANSFFRLNYIHHFEGAFGTKIPLFNKLKITSAAGGGILMIPDANFRHAEFFFGFERIFRIRQQLFRVGIFAATADNSLEKAKFTWKIGIGFYNTFTKKWSY